MNGDHNVADPLVGDIHYPFEHVTRIFIDKIVLPGITDQRQQFIAVFGSREKSWLSNREKNPFCCLLCHYCVNCRRSWRRLGSHVDLTVARRA